MQKSLRVIKRPPRDRGRLEGLIGRISIGIEATSYLHVGSGRELGLTMKEEEIRRILERHGGITERAISEVKFKEGYVDFYRGGGRPIIPGASVKGNVRSRIELSFRAKDGEIRSCFNKAGRLFTVPRKGQRGWRHYRIWGDVIMDDRGPSCDLNRSDRVCLVCDLFGTAGLKSLVEFSDFILKEGKLDELNLGYGMRVLAAPQGSVFYGLVDFMNLKPEELGLIFLGMGLKESRIGREVLLGRMKYRGEISGLRLGKVRYRLEGFYLSEFSERLDLDGFTLEPGSSIEGEKLDELVKSLTSKALETYKDEFEMVDEVGISEGL